MPLHLHRCRPAPRPQLHPRGDQPTGDPGQYRFNDLSKRVRIEHPASREHHHAEKEASALAYGYTGSFQTAEYDHLIPLELGGDPNDSLNLWVEPNDIPGATTTSNSKDVLENQLNYLVCSGQISLFAAQVEISYNWVNTYHTFVGALPSPTTPPTPPPSSGASCQATASPANDGYSGDYNVSITSNQPDQEATASDAGDTWSDLTNSSGDVVILLYYTSPGELITVTVGAASCSTTA